MYNFDGVYTFYCLKNFYKLVIFRWDLISCKDKISELGIYLCF